MSLNCKGRYLMKVLILGGSKSGKSLLAQDIAVSFNKKPLYYVATMSPCDSEDITRINRHVKERDGLGFTTVEQEKNIHEICNRCDKSGAFLIDSITALLSNEMFLSEYDENAAQKIACGLKKVIACFENIVLVSDILHADAAIYDDMTENYRKSLGCLHKMCSDKCDVVLEVCSGNIIVHKGKELYKDVVI